MSEYSASIPISKTVRGYEIKRMPLGKYIKFTQQLKEVSNDITAHVLSNKAALAQLMQTPATTLPLIAFDIVASIPDKLFPILETIFDIPKAVLEEDAAIGLDGLCDMLLAFAEVNRIENFTKAAKTVAAKAKTMLQGVSAG
ncbi:MAG: hypothetical protein LBD16_02445 [Oscillospiraceae bacterium]|nr:hypothetical protein [Oscillospiraceae bacterium]